MRSGRSWVGSVFGRPGRSPSPTKAGIACSPDRARGDFPELEAAAAYAREVLEALARHDALDAGAGEVEMSFERRDDMVVVEGRETLVESTVVAVASGRPRFAAV